MRGMGLDRAEDAIDVPELICQRFALGQRHDGAHVGKVVMIVVKFADVGRKQFADPGRIAARVVRKRMTGAVEVDADLPEQHPFGLVHRTHHLVVDSALLVQPELVVGGIFGNAEIADFAANFFIRVIGMHQRIQLEAELVVKDGQPRFCIERITGAPLHGERRRFGQRHGLAGRPRAADVAFAHQQMLLGVRLAFIGDGKSVDPGEGLRNRLKLDQVEREAGFAMHETGAEGLARVVKIDGTGAKSVGGRLLGYVAEGRRRVRAGQRGQRCDKQEQ